MLMSTRLTALLLTSGDGGVRLCMAMPTVELLQYFGGSQSTAKERRGGWQPPEEAADGDGYGGGRRERRQTPSARAEHPAKPGLTSPAWGQHGEGGSAPTASSRCRIASPFAVAALGWAKLGPLRWVVWRQTGWLRVSGAICSPCIAPGSPRVAFKVTFYLQRLQR